MRARIRTSAGRLGGGRSAAIAAVALVALVGTASLGSSFAAGGGGAKPGKYKGSVYGEDEQPNDKEWVRFRVAGNGRKLKDFTSRLWVICYVGPPTYNITLPVKFTAPHAKIDRRGRVDHAWTEPFTVDGEQETLNGELELSFRGRKATGKIALEFAACGTTTGDPPGSMVIEAKRTGG